MTNRQGRPRTWCVGEADATEASNCLSDTVDRLRAEFEAMPPKKKQETLERVAFFVEEERRDIQRQRRRAPSPLAYLAVQVYGIAVEWVPDQTTREAVEVSK